MVKWTNEKKRNKAINDKQTRGAVRGGKRG